MEQDYDVERREGLCRTGAVVPSSLGQFDIQFFEIDEGMIGKELQHQPADYAWLASMEIAAAMQLAMVQHEVRQTEALLWVQYKAELLGSGVKFVIKDLEAKITLAPEVVELQQQEILAEAECKQLRVLRQALEQKSKMIQSKVGLERSKMDLELQSSRAVVAERFSRNKEGA